MNAAEIVAGIDPHHRLLLVAALCGEDEATAAWRAWRAQVEFDDLDGPSQRLLPLIARRAGVIPDDDPVRQRGRGLYRQSWVRNHRLWHEALPVFEALDSRGIPTLLLKGGALLPVYGDDWGARPMYDIDVLVHDDDFAETVSLLTDLGWIPEQGQSVEWVRHRMRRVLNGWGFEHGVHGHLDLHRRALAGSLWRHADRSFWDGSVATEVAGVTRRVLHPADLLVHLLLHGLQFENNPPVQWVADVVQVTRHCDADDLLPRFVEQARSHAALRVAEAGLGAVHHLVGERTVLPILDAVTDEDSYLERLRHHRGLGANGLAQLARNSTGGAGLRRGVRDLVGRRLELDLVTKPWAAAAQVATGRTRRGTRLVRSLSGGFVRVPVPVTAPLALPVDLDLTDPGTLDRFGGPGWEQVTPGGAVTMGRESYLVLPLVERPAPDAGVGALTIEIEAASLDVAKTVEVTVSGVAVAEVRAEPWATTMPVEVPAEATNGSASVELVLRAARHGARPRPPVYLRVLRVRVA